MTERLAEPRMGGIVGRRLRTPAHLSLAIAFALSSAAPAGVWAAQLMSLSIDATDIQHGIARARLRIPVHAGTATLAYPKWIPGEHEPNGAITQLMDVHIRALGRELSWRRHAGDPFLFDVRVPKGARRVDIALSYYSPPVAFGAGFAKSPGILPGLIILPLNEVLLYPLGRSLDTMRVDASIRLPRGWTADSALASSWVGDVRLERSTLRRLIDSPVLAAPVLTRIPISADPVNVQLVAASSDRKAATPPAELIASLRKLVPETVALLGKPPFRHYDWLLSLDPGLRHDGTEHAESSDIRQSPALFHDPDQAIEWVLFPHEFVHAWNGKFRTPRGLAPRDLQAGMRDDLLWVYEGLTRYYADFVLAARSGIWAPAMSRDYLAFVADEMEAQRPGRGWRSLADTSSTVPVYSDAPAEWSSNRRGADYYNEMLLVWLEADMHIRSRTSGRHSLDDFARAFFGGSNGTPEVRTYSRDGVVRGLRGVLKWDWKKFFEERVDRVTREAPLEGLALSGWRLERDDTPNPFVERVERISGTLNLGSSLGIWVTPEGKVQDVAPGSPAFEAGLAPAAEIRSVDGRHWSIDAIKRAILASEHGDQSAIAISFERFGRCYSISISYRGGLRYPHLARNFSRADTLSQILAPKAQAAHPPLPRASAS